MKGVIRALRGRCPACGQAPLYLRFAELIDRCPSCDVPHGRMEVSWLAAAGLSAFLGLSVAALISVWLTMSGRPVSPPAILVAAGITTLCSYRPFKSLVFSLHWLGLVRDPPRKNNLLVLDFKKKKDRGTG